MNEGRTEIFILSMKLSFKDSLQMLEYNEETIKMAS
jgi:hypothetical protein